MRSKSSGDQAELGEDFLVGDAFAACERARAFGDRRGSLRR